VHRRGPCRQPATTRCNTAHLLQVQQGLLTRCNTAHRSLRKPVCWRAGAQCKRPHDGRKGGAFRRTEGQDPSLLRACRADRARRGGGSAELRRPSPSRSSVIRVASESHGRPAERRGPRRPRGAAPGPAPAPQSAGAGCGLRYPPLSLRVAERPRGPLEPGQKSWKSIES
jgi:hypothetical protein